jgi:hypothetical protein
MLGIGLDGQFRHDGAPRPERPGRLDEGSGLSAARAGRGRRSRTRLGPRRAARRRRGVVTLSNDSRGDGHNDDGDDDTRRRDAGQAGSGCTLDRHFQHRSGPDIGVALRASSSPLRHGCAAARAPNHGA